MILISSVNIRKATRDLALMKS